MVSPCYWIECHWFHSVHAISVPSEWERILLNGESLMGVVAMIFLLLTKEANVSAVSQCGEESAAASFLSFLLLLLSTLEMYGHLLTCAQKGGKTLAVRFRMYTALLFLTVSAYSLSSHLTAPGQLLINTELHSHDTCLSNINADTYLKGRHYQLPSGSLVLIYMSNLIVSL